MPSALRPTLTSLTAAALATSTAPILAVARAAIALAATALAAVTLAAVTLATALAAASASPPPPPTTTPLGTSEERRFLQAKVSSRFLTHMGSKWYCY